MNACLPRNTFETRDAVYDQSEPLAQDQYIAQWLSLTVRCLRRTLPAVAAVAPEVTKEPARAAARKEFRMGSRIRDGRPQPAVSRPAGPRTRLPEAAMQDPLQAGLELAVQPISSRQ